MKRPSKKKAMERIQKARDAIPELRQVDSNSQQFGKWYRDTQIAIENTFGNESRHIEDFNNVRYSLMVVSTSTTDQEFLDAYLRGLDSANAILESMLGEIEEYWEDDVNVSTPPSPEEISRPDTNKVFVIHGRDTGTRDMVARFLERLKLKPVILSEQSNEGLTIIEKFEKHSEVGFAVALLTPDDTGSIEGGEKQPRARQNVIFELGFFIGCIGRKRVCALTKGEVEIPSDYSGVVYISLNDSGGWKFQLCKELKDAGYDIDANRIMQ